jgi:hypothetical protein
VRLSLLETSSQKLLDYYQADFSNEEDMISRLEGIFKEKALCLHHGRARE